MGLATLALLAGLLVMVVSQMIANLNKDKNMKAQQKRAAAFLEKNWKNLKGILNQDQLKLSLNNADFMLAARWRITTYLKGLLGKIKPKLTEAKFAEIRDLLWAKDKAALHYLNSAYDAWKNEMLAAIPDVAKKTEISKVVTAYEAKNKGFQQDKVLWNPGFGFTKCSLT